MEVRLHLGDGRTEGLTDNVCKGWGAVLRGERGMGWEGEARGAAMGTGR